MYSLMLTVYGIHKTDSINPTKNNQYSTTTTTDFRLLCPLKPHREQFSFFVIVFAS